MARNSFGYPADQGFSGSEGLQAEHSQLLGRRGPRFDRSQPASGVESFRGPGAPPDEGPQESPRQRFLNELTARNSGVVARGPSPNSTMARQMQAASDPVYANATATNQYAQARQAERRGTNALLAPAPVATRRGTITYRGTAPAAQGDVQVSPGVYSRETGGQERSPDELAQVDRSRLDYAQNKVDQATDLRQSADMAMLPQTGSPSFSADQAAYPHMVQNQLNSQVAMVNGQQAQANQINSVGALNNANAGHVNAMTPGEVQAQNIQNQTNQAVGQYAGPMAAAQVGRYQQETPVQIQQGQANVGLAQANTARTQAETQQIPAQSQAQIRASDANIHSSQQQYQAYAQERAQLMQRLAHLESELGKYQTSPNAVLGQVGQQPAAGAAAQPQPQQVQQVPMNATGGGQPQQAGQQQSNANTPYQASPQQGQQTPQQIAAAHYGGTLNPDGSMTRGGRLYRWTQVNGVPGYAPVQ